MVRNTDKLSKEETLQLAWRNKTLMRSVNSSFLGYDLLRNKETFVMALSES